jgi:hypothetical protein
MQIWHSECDVYLERLEIKYGHDGQWHVHGLWTDRPDSPHDWHESAVAIASLDKLPDAILEMRLCGLAK